MNEASPSTALILAHEAPWADSLREMGFSMDEVPRASAGCTSLEDALALLMSDDCDHMLAASVAESTATSLPAAASAESLAECTARQVLSSSSQLAGARKRKADGPVDGGSREHSNSAPVPAAGAAAASGAGGSGAGHGDNTAGDAPATSKRRLTNSGVVQAGPPTTAAPAEHLVASLQDMTGVGAAEATAALIATGSLDVLAALEYLNTPAWLRADAHDSNTALPSAASSSGSGTEMQTFRRGSGPASSPAAQAELADTSPGGGGVKQAYREPTPAEAVASLPSIDEVDSDEEHGGVGDAALLDSAEGLGMDAETYALVCQLVAEGGAAAADVCLPSATPPPLSSSSRAPPGHAFSDVSRPDTASSSTPPEAARAAPAPLATVSSGGMSEQQRQRLRALSSAGVPPVRVPRPAGSSLQPHQPKAVSRGGATATGGCGAAKFTPERVRRHSAAPLDAYNANARGVLARGGGSRRGRRASGVGGVSRATGGGSAAPRAQMAARA